ncbi:MAG: bifunctional nuclease family protein [Bacteroidota bacterium]|jgi:bifunctional DNase/RNase
MKKIELQVYAISHSIRQSQSYAVVLEEVNGIRKIPIMIGASEASGIAVALERMKPPRPLAYDLMKNIMLAFNVRLFEIIIYKVEEGVFFSKLICANDNDTIEIDSRTSDAIALAVRFGCPIYAFESILDNASMILEGDPERPTQREVEESEEEQTPSDLSSLSIEELQSLLNEVLEQEDYLKAIAIRDELDRRKQ